MSGISFSSNAVITMHHTLMPLAWISLGQPSPKGGILNVQDEEIPGRSQWYIARFAADDAPDWNSGRYLRTEAAGPNHRLIVLEAEVSREKVPLRNAYKHAGQRASVRVNSGPSRELTGVT